MITYLWYSNCAWWCFFVLNPKYVALKYMLQNKTQLWHHTFLPIFCEVCCFRGRPAVMISNADVVYKKKFIYFRRINRQYIYIYIYIHAFWCTYLLLFLTAVTVSEEVWDSSLRIHVIALSWERKNTEHSLTIRCERNVKFFHILTKFFSVCRNKLSLWL